MGRPATLRIDILADAKGVGKGVGEAEGALGKLGGFAKGAGLAVAAGLAVGAGAAVKLGLDSIAAASTLEQSMGAVDSVFGKAAGSVKGYAADSAMNLGLAKSEYMGLASVVGAQLQSLGYEQDVSAGKTHDLITVGADLAATFGGSVTDAVSAVGSLLRGERDPIERYGIAIKQADVEARLAEQGLDGLEGAARKTAEAEATLALLAEQAGGAHGAFAREADTLAGKQERLGAKFEDVKAAIGERLMPAATALMDFLLTDGVAALEATGRWLTENKDEIVAFGREAAAFGLTFADVLLGLVQQQLEHGARMAEWIATGIGYLGTMVDAAFAMAEGIIDAADSAFGWIPGMGDKIDGAKTKLGELRSTADEKLSAVEGGFRKAAEVADRTAQAVGGVRSGIDNLRDKVVNVTVNTRVVGNQQVAGTSIRGLASTPLHPMTPGLSGAGPDYGAPARLLTAAAGSPGSYAGALAAAATVPVQATTVDARTFVTVQGAVDPVGTARTIRQLLADDARRRGQVVTL